MNEIIPPGPNTSIASLYLIPCGVLSAVALSLCVLRIWSRMRPWPHLDDYLIAVAEIFSLIGFCIGAFATAHGWGRYSYYVSPSDQKTVLKCLFVQEVIFSFNPSIVRGSVACSLLRLSVTVGKAEKIWRWILWSVIAVQVVDSVGFIINLPSRSKTLRGLSTPSQTEDTVIWGWITASFIVLSDLTLAIMPVLIIRTLNRPLREKILISGLMATGLLATGAAMYRMRLFTDYFQSDTPRSGVDITLWVKLEELLGIIAACLPSLKRPAEEMLRRIGVISDRTMQSEILPSFVSSSTNQTLQVDPREDEELTSLGNEIRKNASNKDIPMPEQVWMSRLP